MGSEYREKEERDKVTKRIKESSGRKRVKG
jgi:hypothetical protein